MGCFSHNDKIKKLFPITIALLIGLFIGSMLTSAENEVVEVEQHGTAIVRVAHTNEEVDGYTLIGKHPTEDINVYLPTEFEVIELQEEKQVLVGDSLEAKVLKATTGYFYLEVTDTTIIHAGMSGTEVYLNGVIVGYVSELVLPEGYLKCISVDKNPW